MIEFREVCKSFGDLKVLDQISLTMPRGLVSVLLGPSGSGKSTLLRTINGLSSFDSGEIIVDGISLTPNAGPQREIALKRIRKLVGMVSQQFHLFPHRTALENIIEAPVHVLGIAKETAVAQGRELLARVGLESKANSRPANLSGGQQQRVAIARALAMKPQVILFDEPTSALDPAMTAEVTAVMKDLARDGQSMAVVTHDMNFARSIAGRVFLLDRGQIVQQGPPEVIEKIH